MSLATFTQAYLEAMFWAETDNSDESGGSPMEDNYSPDDLTPEARTEIEKDCADFYEDNNATWEPDWDDEQAGHDFYLTRNGHGAGFWDRGFAAGDALTKAAEVYGTQGLDVGDDGKVYTHS